MAAQPSTIEFYERRPLQEFAAGVRKFVHLKVTKRLMEEVLDKEKLTCSIGVGPNKMTAEIASDFKKAYG